MKKPNLKVAVSLISLCIQAIGSIQTYVDTILDLLDDGEVNNSIDNPLPELVYEVRKALSSLLASVDGTK